MCRRNVLAYAPTFIEARTSWRDWRLGTRPVSFEQTMREEWVEKMQAAAPGTDAPQEQTPRATGAGVDQATQGSNGRRQHATRLGEPPRRR
jgi:hypothetical protein